MAEFRMRKLDPDKCTLTLKLDIRELRVRMAVGAWLIKLGARVIGLGVVIEDVYVERALEGLHPKPEPDDLPNDKVKPVH